MPLGDQLAVMDELQTSFELTEGVPGTTANVCTVVTTVLVLESPSRFRASIAIEKVVFPGRSNKVMVGLLSTQLPRVDEAIVLNPSEEACNLKRVPTGLLLALMLTVVLVGKV